MRKLGNFESSVGRLSSRMLGEDIMLSEGKAFRSFVTGEGPSTPTNPFGGRIPNNLVYAIPVPEEKEEETSKDNVVINLLMQMQALQGKDTIIKNTDVLKKQIIRQIELETSSMKSSKLKSDINKINKAALADNMEKKDFDAIVNAVVDTIKKKRLDDNEESAGQKNAGQKNNRFSELKRLAVHDDRPVYNKTYNVLNESKNITNISYGDRVNLNVRGENNYNETFLTRILKSYEKVQNNENSFESIRNVYGGDTYKSVEKVYTQVGTQKEPTPSETRSTVMDNIRKQTGILNVNENVKNEVKSVNLFENNYVTQEDLKSYNEYLNYTENYTTNHSTKEIHEDEYTTNEYTTFVNNVNQRSNVRKFENQELNEIKEFNKYLTDNNFFDQHVKNEVINLFPKVTVKMADIVREQPKAFREIILKTLSANESRRDRNLVDIYRDDGNRLLKKGIKSGSDGRTDSSSVDRSGTLSEEILRKNMSSVENGTRRVELINKLNVVEDEETKLTREKKLVNKLTSQITERLTEKNEKIFNSMIENLADNKLNINIKRLFTENNEDARLIKDINIKETANKYISESVNRYVDEYINQSVNKLTNETINYSINENIDRFVKNKIRFSNNVNEYVTNEISRVINTKLSETTVNKIDRILDKVNRNVNIFNDVYKITKEDLVKSSKIEDIRNVITRETDNIVQTTNLIKDKENILRTNIEKTERIVDRVNNLVQKYDVVSTKYNDVIRKYNMMVNKVSRDGGSKTNIEFNNVVGKRLSETVLDTFSTESDSSIENYFTNRVELVNRVNVDSATEIEQTVRSPISKRMLRIERELNKINKVSKKLSEKSRINVIDSHIDNIVNRRRILEYSEVENLITGEEERKVQESLKRDRTFNLEHVQKQDVFNTELFRENVAKINKLQNKSTFVDIVKNIDVINKKVKDSDSVRTFILNNNFIDVEETKRQNKLVFNDRIVKNILDSEDNVVERTVDRTISELVNKNLNIIQEEPETPNMVYRENELVHQDGASRSNTTVNKQQSAAGEFVHKVPVVIREENEDKSTSNSTSNQNSDRPESVFEDQLSGSAPKSNPVSSERSQKNFASNLPTINEIQRKIDEERKTRKMVEECVRDMVDVKAISRRIMREVEEDIALSRRRMGF